MNEAEREGYWQVIPGVRAALFKKADRVDYSQLKIAVADIKPTIFSHPEFTAFNQSATKLFKKWRTASLPQLTGLKLGGKPKPLIETLSENLLDTFEHAPLLDAYDVYQRLMDYWADTMQDDAYLIVSDGWRDAAKPRLIVEDKARKTKEKPDFTLGKMKFKAELIPPALVIARYFAAEQVGIEKLEAEVAASTQTMEEMAEEHGGEGGLLADAKNDKDKASVAARLKAIKGDADTADERKALNNYLALAEKEAAASEKLGDAQDTLTAKVAAKYGKLTEDEIKTLEVEDRWLPALAAAVQGELDVSEPGGFKAISRWSRSNATTPPVTDENEPRIPEGCQQAPDGGMKAAVRGGLRSLRDRRHSTPKFRGCHPQARVQPPANGWHPAGMASTAQAGGLEAISRWLRSEATTPPDRRSQSACIPEGCQP